VRGWILSPLISVVSECRILDLRVVAKRVEILLYRWLVPYSAFEMRPIFFVSLCCDPVSYKLLSPVLEEPSKLFHS
jgi:hypothetical protein